MSLRLGKTAAAALSSARDNGGMSTSPAVNRRGVRRCALRQPCSVVLPDGTRLETDTHDLGTDGIALVAERPIAPGTQCVVTFLVPVPRGDGFATVEAKVKTLYSSFEAARQFRIGARFVEIPEAALADIARFAAEAR
jgi:hypothetical protein